MEIQHTQSYGISKISTNRKFTAACGYIKNRSTLNNLTMHLNDLKNKRKAQPKSEERNNDDLNGN